MIVIVGTYRQAKALGAICCDDCLYFMPMSDKVGGRCENILSDFDYVLAYDFRICKHFELEPAEGVQP